MHKMLENATVCVELPEKFKKFNDQSFLEDLFCNEQKSGGGRILMFEYLPSESRALVTYDQESTCQRVVERKEISFLNFTFAVSKYTLPDTSKKLFIMNVPFGKTAADVERYAYYLTGLEPEKLELSAKSKNVWQVTFQEDLGEKLVSIRPVVFPE